MGNVCLDKEQKDIPKCDFRPSTCPVDLAIVSIVNTVHSKLTPNIYGALQDP